jgi:hypothetical protein
MAADHVRTGFASKLGGAVAVAIAAAAALATWAAMSPTRAEPPILAVPAQPCSVLPASVVRRYVPDAQVMDLGAQPDNSIWLGGQEQTACGWLGGGNDLNYTLSGYLADAQNVYSANVAGDLQNGGSASWTIAGLGDEATAVFQSNSSQMSVVVEVWSGFYELTVTAITFTQLTSSPPVSAFTGQLNEATAVARDILPALPAGSASSA